MTNSLQRNKIVGGIVLTLLWICCFLFIKPTLIIDYGAGITMSFKLTVVVIGLLIIVFYHIWYRSSVTTTKLSLTVAFTITWLALMYFYPFSDPESGGTVGFFALVGGLAVCVLWVHFLSDEIFES